MVIAATPQVIYDERLWSAQSDCDCACPSAPPLPRMSPIPNRPLWRHPDLRQRPIDQTHSVAFVPSASRVAVLNDPARMLIDSLSPTRAWQSGDADADLAIATCYQLGLLTDGTDSASPQPADALVAWLHVTNACNLRCTYCYVEKTNEAMSRDVGLAAVDAVIRSACANGYGRVSLKYAGGEASLNMPLVEELHTYAWERAVAAGVALDGRVLSNGTALTTGHIRLMRALGLGLMISLDGLREAHDLQRPTIGGRGSFDRAIAGIERAAALGLPPHISVTVTGSSIAGLAGLVGWLLDRDLPFSINFARQADGAEAIVLEEQRVIAGMRAAFAVIGARPPRRSLLGVLVDRANLGTAHVRTCGVGESYLVVDHRGGVAKCQMELDRPVSSVDAPDPLALVRAARTGVINLSVDEKQGCKSCEWRYWCTGGCAHETFRVTGRYDLQSPHCRIYKALYEDAVMLEGRRLLFHAAQPHAPVS